MKRLLLPLLLLFSLFSSAQIISTTITKDLDTLVLQKEKRNRTIKVGSFSYKDSVISYDTTVSTLKKYVPPTTVNKPPVANAGSDISVTLPVNTVKLDGSASFDPDGTATSLKYYWRKASGPSATLTDTNKAIATVSNLIAGTYEFELRVVDLSNAFTADRMTVVVNPQVTQNLPPVAAATSSPSSITLPVNSVNLSAAASSDPDGSIVSWQWLKVSGPNAGLIASANSQTTSVSQMTLAGTYVYRITVTDNRGASANTTISVVVNPEVVNPPGTTYNINLSQIPFSDPDLVAPGRGAEQWHDRTDVNIPQEGAPQQPADRYHRFVWTRLEGSTQGSYNWTWFDNLVKECINKRQKLNFGIMTVYTDVPSDQGGANYDGGTSAYPEYLHNLMQGESVKDFRVGNSWIPNYNSQHYLNRLLALNQALNAHIEATSFNLVRFRDVIGIIDIRGYGNWGEWHSVYTGSFQVSQYPSGTFPTVASLKKIVDAHVIGFPNHQLVCMIAAFDAQWLGNTYNPNEIAHYILTHKGNNYGPIGWRRDQWGALDDYLKRYLENNDRSFNGLVFKDSIMVRWKTAPITGEPPAWNPEEYRDLERQIRLYHASSFGNGNYGGGVAPSQLATRDRIRAASKASGYRYVLEPGSKVVTAPNSISISLNWRNAGLAPTYERWNVVFELVNSSGVAVWSATSTFQLKLFQPQTLYTTVVDGFGVNVPAGTYTLRMSIKDPTGYRRYMPIYMQGRNTDNSINLVTGIRY